MRIYCLHNCSDQHGYAQPTKFVDTRGIVCQSTENYLWYQHMGVFKTRGDATRYARANNIKLDVHSITVHQDWMYESMMKDLVKEV